MMKINLHPNPVTITVIRPSRRGEKAHKNYSCAKMSMAHMFTSRAKLKKEMIEDKILKRIDRFK